jgi:hypothetical protein
VQAGVHLPATQTGAVAGHCEDDVHVFPVVGFGSHAPFEHVYPAGHDVALQSGTHCPSAHTSPAGHWLENWQAFDVAVQTPATQTWPVAHSAFPVQAHGPSVPPQVGPASWPPSVPGGPASGGGVGVPPSTPTQTLATHASPMGQSAFVVHCTGVPGVVPGGTQSPDVQTSPWGHCPLDEHDCSHPPVVQTNPLGQLFVPVHETVLGGETGAHEYPSQV